MIPFRRDTGSPRYRARRLRLNLRRPRGSEIAVRAAVARCAARDRYGRSQLACARQRHRRNAQQQQRLAPWRCPVINIGEPLMWRSVRALDAWRVTASVSTKAPHLGHPRAAMWRARGGAPRHLSSPGPSTSPCSACTHSRGVRAPAAKWRVRQDGTARARRARGQADTMVDGRRRGRGACGESLSGLSLTLTRWTMRLSRKAGGERCDAV